MKTMIQAAAVTLFAASAADAQQAVQWKVSDGGNGHWYEIHLVPDRSWPSADTIARAVGGHLATITTTSEQIFAGSLALTTGAFEGADGPYLGGYKDDSGALSWGTGEPVTYLGWGPGEPNGGLSERYVHLKLYGGQPAWNDCPSPLANSCVIEWSADCNNDGIVDYGQCRDGSLPDYNGDNVPDCCESGARCVVGTYPIEWRGEEGGNGHWYASAGQSGLRFEQAYSLATAAGAMLVMPKSPAALSFVFERLAGRPAMWWSPAGVPRHGPWIGLIQDTASADYQEPNGGWRWMDGTSPSYFNWASDPCNSQPADCFCGTSICGLNHAGFYTGGDGPPTPGSGWGAFASDMHGAIGGVILEWSTDCNGDGIIDKGQILRGELTDANGNGIPDICQAPTCVDADLFRDFNVDGADLGILLAQWGPNTPLTVSDINDDGIVDGADLGLLLSFWGACP